MTLIKYRDGTSTRLENTGFVSNGMALYAYGLNGKPGFLVASPLLLVEALEFQEDEA